MLKPEDVEYFNRGEAENHKFWQRLGGEISFAGQKILDIGCGHGSLCVEMASKGADYVLGIDVNKERISFAIENVKSNYPELINKVQFYCCDVLNLPEHEAGFDVIVSKDSLEHILNLDKVMIEIKERLKTGGKLYLGFGPLYNSPFGDHGRTKAPFRLPWGHLIFPEKFLLKRVNKISIKQRSTIYDMGLNKLSLGEYRRIFSESGMKTVFVRTNVNNRLASKPFTLAARLPFLEELFTHNLYCILQK